MMRYFVTLGGKVVEWSNSRKHAIELAHRLHNVTGLVTMVCEPDPDWGEAASDVIWQSC